MRLRKPSLEQRGYLYRVAGAIGLLVGSYGLVDDTKLAAWLGLAAAVLGNGLAAGHTTIRKRPPGN